MIVGHIFLIFFSVAVHACSTMHIWQGRGGQGEENRRHAQPGVLVRNFQTAAFALSRHDQTGQERP